MLAEFWPSSVECRPKSAKLRDDVPLWVAQIVPALCDEELPGRSSRGPRPPIDHGHPTGRGHRRGHPPGVRHRVGETAMRVGRSLTCARAFGPWRMPPLSRRPRVAFCAPGISWEAPGCQLTVAIPLAREPDCRVGQRGFDACARPEVDARPRPSSAFDLATRSGNRLPMKGDGSNSDMRVKSPDLGRPLPRRTDGHASSSLAVVRSALRSGDRFSRQPRFAPNMFGGCRARHLGPMPKSAPGAVELRLILAVAEVQHARPRRRLALLGASHGSGKQLAQRAHLEALELLRLTGGLVGG